MRKREREQEQEQEEKHLMRESAHICNNRTKFEADSRRTDRDLKIQLIVSVAGEISALSQTVTEAGINETVQC